MARPEQPQIVIDGTADPSIARRIAAIDRAIDRKPDEFVAAMRSLGEQATASVIELADMEQRVPTATRKPAELIKEFLGNRYDLNSEFDETTETTLAEDEAYQDLVRDMQSKKSVTVKTGQMMTKTRHNPEADSARDALRRYRFGFYLGRVAAYKSQEAALRSAI